MQPSPSFPSSCPSPSSPPPWVPPSALPSPSSLYLIPNNSGVRVKKSDVAVAMAWVSELLCVFGVEGGGQGIHKNKEQHNNLEENGNCPALIIDRPKSPNPCQSDYFSIDCLLCVRYGRYRRQDLKQTWNSEVFSNQQVGSNLKTFGDQPCNEAKKKRSLALALLLLRRLLLLGRLLLLLLALLLALLLLLLSLLGLFCFAPSNCFRYK